MSGEQKRWQAPTRRATLAAKWHGYWDARRGVPLDGDGCTPYVWRLRRAADAGVEGVLHGLVTRLDAKDLQAVEIESPSVSPDDPPWLRGRAAREIGERAQAHAKYDRLLAEARLAARERVAIVEQLLAVYSTAFARRSGGVPTKSLNIDVDDAFRILRGCQQQVVKGAEPRA